MTCVQYSKNTKCKSVNACNVCSERICSFCKNKPATLEFEWEVPINPLTLQRTGKTPPPFYCYSCVSTRPNLRKHVSPYILETAKYTQNTAKYSRLINAVEHRREILCADQHVEEIYLNAKSGLHLNPSELRYIWNALQKISRQ